MSADPPPTSQPRASLTRQPRGVLTRRHAIAGGAAAAWVALAPATARAATPGAIFDFEAVVDLAAELAATPYASPRYEPQGAFAGVDYDDYRAIRYREDRQIWRGQERNFTVDLLPPGWLYRDRVRVALVEDGEVKELALDPSVFEFDPSRFPEPVDHVGVAHWSGFRLRFPLNRPDYQDEVLVFQGASYFRAIARDLIYGLSARGLAVNVGGAEGEEFPNFTDFWLHRPEKGATRCMIHALLDSPSLAGAFEFIVQPGAETTMQTRARLFAREEVASIGYAPLTSMFWFGPLDRSAVDDFRSAVHDSDGLQMTTGAGERLWRPLANPATLQVSSFADQAPKSFGLAQRHRDFDWYQDAEARYERRPSAWIAPVGDWGEGAVRLFEIPTDSEFNDNIVAYWASAEPLRPGAPRDVAYSLIWGAAPPAPPEPLARVVASRSGRAVNDPDLMTVVVDFAGDGLAPDVLSAELHASAGEVTTPVLKTLPGGGALRCSFDLTPPAEGVAELRLVLRGPDGAAASETWLHRWAQR